MSEAPLEPAQVATPSSTGLYDWSSTSVLSAVGGFMGNAAPDPGPMGGFGGGADLSAGAGTFGNYGAMCLTMLVTSVAWNSNIDYNVGFTPMLGGSSFFGD